ncbi:MAG: hypothetical protein MRERV_19c018 [Mycoplasmataceae bacterium RV_VA103A]|nr:MAG: hypothetical protein MRERV_19c018 [Mycoplasmataceae bacterium RV_VA103A]
MANIISIGEGETTTSSRFPKIERTNYRVSYHWNNRIPICQETYFNMLGISLKYFESIKSHLLDKGLSARTHGNTGKIPIRKTKMLIDENNEIPVGKYYELHGKQLDTFYKMGDYCSPCWDKEKTQYEIEIKNGMLKVAERERERERERESKTKVKLSGCQCQYKDKEFEAIITDWNKLNDFKEDKDIACCSNCWKAHYQKKYGELAERVWFDFQDTNHQVVIIAIYGGKKEDEPTTEKCADCQTKKNSNELLTIQVQDKEIKICQACKTKRDNKPEIPKPDKPEIPEKDNPDPSKNDPTKNPNSENEKVWGKDFGQLKPQQRTDRITINNNYKQSCEDSKKMAAMLCQYCQKEFEYDKSIKNFLPAREKAKQARDTHEATCPIKDNKRPNKKN